MDSHQSRKAWRRDSALMWVTVLVGMAAAAVALLVASPTIGYVPPWVMLLLVSPPLAIVLGVVGVWWLLRHRGVAWVQPSPLLALGYRERRLLLRAISRNEPITTDKETTAKIIIRDIQNKRRLLILSPVLICISAVFNAANASLPGFLRWSCIAAAVLAVGLFWRQVRFLRRVRRAAQTLQHSGGPDRVGNE